MSNLTPIRKVTAGAVMGVIVYLLQLAIPAWHDHIPADVQIAIPYVSAVAAAYITKLEDKYLHPNV